MRASLRPCPGRVLLLAATCLAVSALAAPTRPPPRGQARAELLAPPSGPGDTPGARFVAGLPKAAQDTLAKKGQVVLDQESQDGGPALVKAVVRFQRPRDEVFAIITRPTEQQDYLPNVKSTRTFGERTAEGENVDTVVSFLLTFKYRTQHWFYPEASRMEWNLDPAGEDGLEDQLGFWQLYVLDEKTTIAEYGTRVVARGALLNFLRKLGERGAINDALSAIRAHVDGAPAKP